MGDILRVEGLCKEFSLEAGFFQKNRHTVYAVNDLSFNVPRGKTYGILGESGSGKTTTARLVIRMYRASAGRIVFIPEDGVELDVGELKGRELKSYREKVKYVFQDPARSLNPRLSVFEVMTAALRYSGQWKGRNDAFERASRIVQEVGLSEDDLFRRSAEFSGGQRQRISIARALVMNPSLLLCDEVVSALDVSIQGQIVNLLSDLKESRSLSYIFITHDLKVASYFCDVVGVMFRGLLVEEGGPDLYRSALHPYTRLLFRGADFSGERSSFEADTALVREDSCPFAHRCPYAEGECKKSLPPLRLVEEGHRVRCFKV